VNTDVSQTRPIEAGGYEPKANWTPVPVWLLILLLLLIYWGMWYFDEHGGLFSQEVYTPYRSEAELAIYQPRTEGPNLILGREKFEQVCSVCHNSDGMGKPGQAPPLAGSEWAQGSPARMIRIPLYGLNGPITVKGQQMSFPIPMVAVGQALPEDDLAAVLSYVRQAWGNKASPVTADQIKAVKTQLGNRSQPFTPEELMQVPEK
jgi:mono/diheme cytochrome c family protein